MSEIAIQARPAPLAIQPDAPADAMIAMIERASRDPSVDLDKLERLLAMKEKADAQIAERAFNEAMRAAQAEMPKVVKDAENTHTRSRYARHETLLKAITPVITRHGFSLSFGTEPGAPDGFHRVTCRISHVDGHSRVEAADIPADGKGARGNDNKTATHAFGSTMSYGRRYLTLLIFNIATGDDDDGNRAGSSLAPIGDAERQTIETLLTETESDWAAFCEFWQIDGVADLPAVKYPQALMMLQQRKKVRGK